MKQILTVVLFGGFMLGIIGSLFGMSVDSGSNTDLKYREILFTGSKLRIGMPENFSKDFPADDVLTNVVLTEGSGFINPDSENPTQLVVLRRWWDFNKKAFFGSTEIGTIMLDISVVQSPDVYSDRFSLIETIHTSLTDQYEDFNEGADAGFVIAFPQTFESFFEEEFSDQRWLAYAMASMNSMQATKTYVTPLSNLHYLKLSFTMMPSFKVDIRQFEDEYVRGFVEKVMNTIELRYEDNSLLKQLGFDTAAIGYSELLESKDSLK